MSSNGLLNVSERVSELYKQESRRIYATLVRLIGDFDLAEEVIQESFATALQKWQVEGTPSNPRAWLISTAKHKAIDIIRRRTRFDKTLEEHCQILAPGFSEAEEFNDESFDNDLLRLVFTCCHPALSLNAQIALTLREICGLTTEEIASAFLSSPVTIAQRIVRAKAKIRDAKIPYVIPNKSDLPERLDAVLTVIYLVFNEGYSASSGERVTRSELSEKAIYLGRTLTEIMPDPEVKGLLALMLLHESRRVTRTDKNGDIILLEEQDRKLWNKSLIDEGAELVSQALNAPEFGTYTIQAAISATHARAQTSDETDWTQIVSFYDLLMQAEPSPIVELNRSVAVAMRDGPSFGLVIIEDLIQKGELTDYHLLYAAHADLNRRLGRRLDALHSYQLALKLVKQEPERRFLERRIKELSE